MLLPRFNITRRDFLAPLGGLVFTSLLIFAPNIHASTYLVNGTYYTDIWWAGGHYCAQYGQTAIAVDPAAPGIRCSDSFWYIIVAGPPTCPEGTTENTETKACEEDAEPEPCDGKPEDWVEMEFTVGGETSTYCAPPFEPPEECSDPEGTITFGGETHVVCNDRKNECESTGGTYGFYNGEETCLPPEFDDDLPTCDSDGAISMTWDESTGTGGFVCESPIKPDPDLPKRDNPRETDTDQDGIPNEADDDIDGDGIPNHLDDDIDGDGVNNFYDIDIDGDQINNNIDPDVDGDGIPNNTDGDVDGDGVPNSQDTDSDGDGVPNADDPTPNGNQQDNSELAGGKSCNVTPFCKGDAIQCAIHYQLWKTRCEEQKQQEQQDLLTDVDSSFNPGVIDYSDTFSTAVDDAISGITGDDLDGQGVSSLAQTVQDSIIGIFPTAQACTDIVISFFGKANLVISCIRLQQMRDLLGWLLYVLTAYYLFKLALTPIESKV